jgi:hypothetical protein
MSSESEESSLSLAVLPHEMYVKFGGLKINTRHQFRSVWTLHLGLSSPHFFLSSTLHILNMFFIIEKISQNAGSVRHIAKCRTNSRTSFAIVPSPKFPSPPLSLPGPVLGPPSPLPLPPPPPSFTSHIKCSAFPSLDPQVFLHHCRILLSHAPLSGYISPICQSQVLSVLKPRKDISQGKI